MTIFVTKVDGRKQLFDKQKVICTCLRMRSSLEQANIIANKVEKKAYDGIQTREILRMIFSYLKTYKPEIKYKIDLREAISLLRPKPDFEIFIGLLLKEYGYQIEMNQIINGKCVDHEIDAIARKKDEVILVEVKHHLQHHTYTGVGVFLESYAIFEDLIEGYKTGKNKINFNRLLVVCNTKISEHGERYSTCKNIQHVGWRYPKDNGLERMVEDKRFYPITLIKGLDFKTQEKFGDHGIILLKQLVEMGVNELWIKTRIPRPKLEVYRKKAKEILEK
jgi:hypothetical protein